VGDLWREDRAEETRPLDQVQQAPDASPRPVEFALALRDRLDGFWIVVGVVLLITAVFVAFVSYSSMAKVGPQELTSQARLPHLDQQAPAPFVIVQLGSYPTQAAAKASVRRLAASSTNAKILDSSDYRGLTRGFVVAYLGPFDDTDAGHAQAKREQARFPEALIRTISRR
jgi:SPOR domain